MFHFIIYGTVQSSVYMCHHLLMLDKKLKVCMFQMEKFVIALVQSTGRLLTPVVDGEA